MGGSPGVTPEDFSGKISEQASGVHNEHEHEHD